MLVQLGDFISAKLSAPTKAELTFKAFFLPLIPLYPTISLMRIGFMSVSTD
jgi:hypothetical protein